MAQEHAHYEDVDKRLARIEGHVRGVRKMWQEQRPCPEVLLQLAAVRAALQQAARLIMRDHVESCIAKAVEKGKGEGAVEELTEALERLM